MYFKIRIVKNRIEMGHMAQNRKGVYRAIEEMAIVSMEAWSNRQATPMHSVFLNL